MVDGDAALAGALDELAALGTGEDRERIAALRDRLNAARLRVLVAGAAKRGKSTLINALLADAFGGELRTASSAEIERQGRARLVALTVAAADAWRAGWQRTLEEGLASTDIRLTADLTAALEVLRDSAAELLGLDLTVPDPGGRLAEDRRFFYTTSEEAGQTELLAGAIRRRLPGELGRRSARDRLRREAPGLVASQIGRARGDLQYRLSETSRTLASSVEHRYAEATGRMRTALQAAEDLRPASAAEAAEADRELSKREAAVHHALTLLGEPARAAGRADSARR